MAKGALKRALASLDKTATIIRNGTFAVFVDETGHEEFKADGRLFGFAGVAGYGAELVRSQRKWRAMKAAHFGGATEKLHASGPMMSREQLDAISQFFAETRIGRFAYVLEEPPIELPGNALTMLRDFLGERLLDSLDTLTTTPTDIVICFEQSNRLLPKLLEAVPGIKVSIEDKDIPCTLLITPKDAGSEHLEMADQVAHRAQRQFREKSGSVYPEFEAVFPASKPRHARYGAMRIASVQRGEWEIVFETPTTARVRRTFRPPATPD